MNRAFWRGKKVLITGHTGFKGSWLALWLQQLGAEVFGFALKPATSPNLFERADVARHMTSIIGDIRELPSVKQAFISIRPEIVIHMAAQSLVRYSYQHPLETYQTNVMGTLHVLEAIRNCKNVRAAVMVTTDKCYENKEWVWAYRENEPMGGDDPYSSSKGCAELLIASYRKSFFSDRQETAIASARAGNVIGGGDWSEDRLVPDIIKAFQARKPVRIRNPQAIRPWQYVLEALAGYLTLAEKLYVGGNEYAEAWNFGPKAEAAQSVQWIMDRLSEHYAAVEWEVEDSHELHEAQILKLDSTKAHERLGWTSACSLTDALKKIVEWHRYESCGEDMNKISLRQIEWYEQHLNQS